MVGSVLNALFINCTIIVSAITLATMLLRDKYRGKSWRNSLINGALAGILGWLLMMYSVPISAESILDFRLFPILIMGLYVSFSASIETAVLIGLFRIVYFGMNRASLTALLISLGVALSCGLIGRSNLSIRFKWLLAVACLCLVSGIGLSTLIIGLDNRLEIMLVYQIATIVMALIMFFFMEYIAAFNRQVQKLRDEAENDYLTGLVTSRHFDRSLAELFETAIADHRNISVLYIDVDYFKNVNDSYGHLHGDLVLKEISLIFKQAARSHDIISRNGGDEFTIILVDCSLRQALTVSERIRSAVEAYEFKLSETERINITVSIGIASLPETAKDQAMLLQLADQALYQAKRGGRNRIVVAARQMTKESI